MELAKQQIDVGISADLTNEQALLDFWQGEVGLAHRGILPLGGESRQQRHSMNGSVLKINARPGLEEAAPSGYRAISIAREGVTEPQELTDPDGNRVTLVPPGTDGITGIAIDVAVRDAEAFRRFYGDIMQMETVAENTYRSGDTLLRVQQSEDAGEAPGMAGKGYRYITLEVRDLEKEYAGLMERGATEGVAPRMFGEYVRVSMVNDPDGNVVEIIERVARPEAQ